MALLLALGIGQLGCERLGSAWGHVQSENGEYPNGRMRCWIIAPPGSPHIHLSFKSFQTEGGFDIVRVYDGSSTNDPQLTPTEGLSGTITPAPLDASSGAMLITFESDYLVRMAGFTFAWTSDDGTPLPPGMCALNCTIATDLHNGRCELACYNQQCMWDEGDCALQCNATSSCASSQMADGTCDPRCLVAGCDFDRQDCECDNLIEQPYGALAAPLSLIKSTHRLYLLSAPTSHAHSLSPLPYPHSFISSMFHLSRRPYILSTFPPHSRTLSRLFLHAGFLTDGSDEQHDYNSSMSLCWRISLPASGNPPLWPWRAREGRV